MQPTDRPDANQSRPKTERPSRFRNLILKNLPQNSIDRLELTAVPLSSKREIEFSGNVINNIFFIESGIGSMTMTFVDGTQVEVGLFGFEAAIGISALMGTKRSLNRVFMQVGGHGYVSPIGKARAEFERNSKFHELALRYVQAQLNQSNVSAACNLRHKVPQRMARWLLLCVDRAQDSVIELSQEFLGVMLGIRRTTVTAELSKLADAGAISHRRRRIEILDRSVLEERACECYGMLSRYLHAPDKYDDGFVI